MTRNIANIAATTTKAGLKFRAYNLDKMPHQPLKQLLILLTRVNVLIIRVLALRRGNKAITWINNLATYQPSKVDMKIYVMSDSV